jgi:hypothetical protein
MSVAESLSAITDPSQAPLERRASVRYPCDLDTSCQPIASARGMQWTGKVQNISRGGLSLVLGRRFELGTLLAIEVQGKDGHSSARTLLARIVHIALQGPNTWVMGCKFSSELSDEELKVLL